jgi:hypothetical protein
VGAVSCGYLDDHEMEKIQQEIFREHLECSSAMQDLMMAKIMEYRGMGNPPPIYGPVLPTTGAAYVPDIPITFVDWKTGMGNDAVALSYPEIMALPHMVATRRAFEDGNITSEEYNQAITAAVARFTDIETPEAAPKYKDLVFHVEEESDGSQTITVEDFPDSTLIGDGILDHPTPYCYREKNKVVINVSNGYAEYVLGEPSLSSRATEAHRVYLKEK